MDLNDARSAITVIGLLLFIGIVGWTWQRARRAGFDEAARLPLADDEQPGSQR